MSRVGRALRLTAALLKAAVSVKPVALIWDLAQMDILTIGGHQPNLKHAMAARCDSNCKGKAVIRRSYRRSVGGGPLWRSDRVCCNKFSFKRDAFGAHSR